MPERPEDPARPTRHYGTTTPTGSKRYRSARTHMTAQPRGRGAGTTSDVPMFRWS